MNGQNKKWGVVEVLGRRKLAGRIWEEERFGVKGLMVEVPQGDDFLEPQFFTGASLFSVGFTPEEFARAVAGSYEVRAALELVGVFAPNTTPQLTGYVPSEDALQGRINRALRRLRGPSSLITSHLRMILEGEDIDPVEWEQLPDIIELSPNQEERVRNILVAAEKHLVDTQAPSTDWHWHVVDVLRDVLDDDAVDAIDAPTAAHFAEFDGDEPMPEEPTADEDDDLPL